MKKFFLTIWAWVKSKFARKPKPLLPIQLRAVLLEEMVKRDLLTVGEVVRLEAAPHSCPETFKKVDDFFQSKQWKELYEEELKDQQLFTDGPVILRKSVSGIGNEIVGYMFGRYPATRRKGPLKGSKAAEQQAKTNHDHLQRLRVIEEQKQYKGTNGETYSGFGIGSSSDVEELSKAIKESK
jgi:hypothetical protein